MMLVKLWMSLSLSQAKNKVGKSQSTFEYLKLLLSWFNKMEKIENLWIVGKWSLKKKKKHCLLSRDEQKDCWENQKSLNETSNVRFYISQFWDAC